MCDANLFGASHTVVILGFDEATGQEAIIRPGRLIIHYRGRHFINVHAIICIDYRGIGWIGYEVGQTLRFFTLEFNVALSSNSFSNERNLWCLHCNFAQRGSPSMSMTSVI